MGDTGIAQEADHTQQSQSTISPATSIHPNVDSHQIAGHHQLTQLTASHEPGIQNLDTIPEVCTELPPFALLTKLLGLLHEGPGSSSPSLAPAN